MKQNEFQRNLTSGFISRRPKEKLKITVVETAHKLPTQCGKRGQAIKCIHGPQQWLYKHGQVSVLLGVPSLIL